MGDSGIAAAPSGIHRPELARAAGMRWLLRRAECVFSVFALLVLSGAVTPLLRRQLGVGVGDANGDPLTRKLLALIYLIAGAMALIYFRSTVRAVARYPWAVALPILAVFSASWSDSPDLTIRRGLGLCATTVVGLYFATRFDLAQLVRLLAWSLGLAALVSLLASLVAPSLGVLSTGGYAGAWRGLFDTKNEFGRAMALAVVTFLVLRTGLSGRRWIALAGAGLSGGLVLLSTSKTALVATVVLLLLLRFYRVLRRSAGAATLVAIGVLLIGGIPAVWIASEADTMLAALGRDPTLTGRTVLWTFVAESIRQRPWLGYGFSAFWTSSNTASRAIIDELHWSTPHAHNGFLDLTLELGVIGLAVFLLGYVVAVLRAIRVVRSAEAVPALWPITYLTFLFLYNLTESASLKQGSIFWVLYVATLCSPMWAPSARGSSRGVTARGSQLPGRLSIGVRQRMWPRLSAMRHRHSDRA